MSEWEFDHILDWHFKAFHANFHLRIKINRYQVLYNWLGPREYHYMY